MEHYLLSQFMGGCVSLQRAECPASSLKFEIRGETFLYQGTPLEIFDDFEEAREWAESHTDATYVFESWQGCVHHARTSHGNWEGIDDQVACA